MATGPHIWSEEALLRKARVYFQRASDGDPGSGLYPLWSLIGLEFLARATLSSVHPALLADPQEGTNLLHAFGYGEPKPPRSVPITTVFRRCQAIIPLFTERMKDDGIALMNLRNEELHSGGLALDTLPTSAWQPQFYSLCSVLLDYLELTFEDVFPDPRGAAARLVLEGLEQDVESEVKEEIAERRRHFEEWTEDERLKRRRREAEPREPFAMAYNRERIAECPACQSKATVSGETSGMSEPRVGEDEIEREIQVLPTSFRCGVCGLTLSGHAELHHAGLGDEFTVLNSDDPLDYYGIDPKDYVTIDDLIEPDYGND